MLLNKGNSVTDLLDECKGETEPLLCFSGSKVEAVHCKQDSKYANYPIVFLD